MLFDTLTRGTMRTKIGDKVKDMTERMCQDEYNTLNDRGIKKKVC